MHNKQLRSGSLFACLDMIWHHLTWSCHCNNDETTMKGCSSVCKSAVRMKVTVAPCDIMSKFAFSTSQLPPNARLGSQSNAVRCSCSHYGMCMHSCARKVFCLIRALPDTRKHHHHTTAWCYPAMLPEYKGWKPPHEKRYSNFRYISCNWMCRDFTDADTCESLEITSSDKMFGCSITRTWTASGCDESASADQLVTLTGDCCDGMILSLQLYSSR